MLIACIRPTHAEANRHPRRAWRSRGFWTRARRALPVVLGCALGGLAGCEVFPGSAEPVGVVEDRLRKEFNGVILAERDGEIDSFLAYGRADAALDVSNTTRHRFRIGSVSKTFTSAMIARLQEQGRLDVDDPLSKHLPPSSDFPGGNKITLRHLVDHRSGIGDLDQDDFRKLLLGERPLTLDEVVDLLKQKKPSARPGDTKEYNNAGYIVLGKVIERATGTSYIQALQDEFLTPLGMTNTGFAAFDSDVEGLAVGHLAGMKPDPQRYNYSGILPAGGLYSTAEDLRTWCHALESIEPAWYRTEHLGWTSGTRYGREAVWHAGNTNTYAAFLVRFPGSRSCFVVLSNEGGARGIPAPVRGLAAAVFEPK